MTYTTEQLAEFRQRHPLISMDLQMMMLQSVAEAQQARNAEVRKFLTHGVGRRLSILQKSTDKIFRIFPPDQDQVLSQDAVTDVQIYLHAFVINIYGTFDNWAWAFVHRHNLMSDIRDRRNVGMFKGTTQRFLPATLRDYLASDDIRNWYEHYLKNYRDALAHRIPLYIPPANWTDVDAENYRRLEAEEWRLIREQDFARLEEVRTAKCQIGSPCFIFLHEYSAEDNARPLLLHGQILSDGLTVLEFGQRFYQEWHNRS